MNWKALKLGDVCDVSIGKTPSRSSARYWDKDKLGANIWLSIADLTKANGRIINDSKEYISDNGAALFKLVPKGTLLMSFKLTIGKLAIAGCDLRTNEAIAALLIKDKNLLSRDFLYYYLSSLNWDEIAGSDIKVKGKTLNKAKLKEVEVILPSLIVQKRIVAKLDAMFVEIDKAINVAEIKTVEIAELKTVILSKALNNQEWDPLTINDVCSLQPPKGQVKNKLNKNDDVSFMPMKILGIDKMFATSDQKNQLTKVYSNYTYFENNDVLLAKITPCFENGKLGIATNLLNGVGFGSSEYLVFRCNKKILPQFLYYYFSQPNFREDGKAKMTGAVGHKRVPKDFIQKRRIFLPPISQQKLIVTKLDSVFTGIDASRKILVELKQNYICLKSAILSKELEQNEVA